jgi:Na+/proline symporter
MRKNIDNFIINLSDGDVHGYEKLFLTDLIKITVQFSSGIVLYAPALALEALTGLNRSYSIVIVGAVCTFYSTIGGMKAVLLTDVFQSVLMYIAVLAIVISGLIYAEGFGNIFKAADEGDRLELWK